MQGWGASSRGTVWTPSASCVGGWGSSTGGGSSVRGSGMGNDDRHAAFLHDISDDEQEATPEPVLPGTPIVIPQPSAGVCEAIAWVRAQKKISSEVLRTITNAVDLNKFVSEIIRGDADSLEILDQEATVQYFLQVFPGSDETCNEKFAEILNFLIGGGRNEPGQPAFCEQAVADLLDKICANLQSPSCAQVFINITGIFRHPALIQIAMEKLRDDSFVDAICSLEYSEQIGPEHVGPVLERLLAYKPFDVRSIINKFEAIVGLPVAAEQQSVLVELNVVGAVMELLQSISPDDSDVVQSGKTRAGAMGLVFLASNGIDIPDDIIGWTIHQYTIGIHPVKVQLVKFWSKYFQAARDEALVYMLENGLLETISSDMDTSDWEAAKWGLEIIVEFANKFHGDVIPHIHNDILDWITEAMTDPMADPDRVHKSGEFCQAVG